MMPRNTRAIFRLLQLICCCLLTIPGISVGKEACRLVDKDTGKHYRIFNGLVYDSVPDLSNYCIEPINIMYTWNFFPRGGRHGDYSLPKGEVLERAIRRAESLGVVTVIDIEHWPLKGADKERKRQSVMNYVEVLAEMKQRSPDLMIGYYGVVPVIDFSRAKLPGTRQHREWVSDNTNVQPIADIVDATFPSLYTINPNQADWRARAVSHISESQRLAPGKKVFPFIWPNYHEQGGRYPLGTEVEQGYWRMQLEFLRSNADGVVLWGGNKQEFDEEMIWWKETVNFIEENFRKENYLQH